MAVNSLRGTINDTLILRFAGLSQSDASSSQSVAQALRGSSGSKTSIRDGIRFGARTLASAVQSLNGGITMLNIAQSTLGKLGKLTDGMLELAERATLPGTGRQARERLNLEFRKLGREFRAITDDASFGEVGYLTVEGLSALLTNIGLDKERSDSIDAVFRQFVVPSTDDALASEMMKGPTPVFVPASAYSTPVPVSRSTTKYDELFDGDIDLSNRPNAYRVLNDLKALRGQIDDNMQALDHALTVIGDNIDFVRAAGLALLEIEEEITGEVEAHQVARLLRKEIRQNAPAALAQAENLEPIIVAALVFDTE